jgi:hypothetical protein
MIQDNNYRKNHPGTSGIMDFLVPSERSPLEKILCPSCGLMMKRKDFLPSEEICNEYLDVRLIENEARSEGHEYQLAN